MGLLVLRYEDPRGRDSDLDGDGDVDLRDYSLLQHAVGQAGCGTAADLNEDGRVSGDDVAVMVNDITGPM
jgi:hypothetical protein